eukprot:SAG31_NODE_9394_length_1284_cov_4.587342_1_plen_422_part_10
MAASPRHGVAAVDAIVLSTRDWVDEDLPLIYRFGWLMNSVKTYVSEYSVLDSTSTVLPAGRSTHNYTVTVFAEVRDELGATAMTTAAVTIAPFVPPANVSLSSFAADLVNGSGGAGVGQVIGSLAAAINMDTDESNDSMDAEAQAEAAAVREVLVDAMLASANTIDSSSVARASQLMSSITANPEQLTSTATDKALNVALSLTEAADSAAVDVENLVDLAGIVSNLVSASASQYNAADDSVAPNDPVDGSARAAMVTKIVDTVGSIFARDCVPGEPERTLATSSVVLHISVKEANDFANSTIGGGRVTVPAIPAAAVQAIAKVTTWSDAGPLIWAADKIGESNATLESPLLSVKFSHPNGSEIQISDLPEPFTIVMDVDASDNRTNRRSRHDFSCAYWDINRSQFVVDGELVARTETNVTCQ